MKENGFKLAKEKSRRYPTQTIMDVNYADNIVLHLPKPNPCYIAWNKASMSMQTKHNTCALIKEVTSPH